MRENVKVVRETSKAFEEFVAKRCEEIITGNSEQDLNKLINILEMDLYNHVSKDVVKTLQKIDDLKEKQIVNNYIKLYKHGLNDRIIHV